MEAAGADDPLRPENWEKLRLRVVAMPLRRRHAARWVFIAVARDPTQDGVGVWERS